MTTARKYRLDYRRMGNFELVESSVHPNIAAALERLELARAYYGGGDFHICEENTAHLVLEGRGWAHPPGPPPHERGEKRPW